MVQNVAHVLAKIEYPPVIPFALLAVSGTCAASSGRRADGELVYRKSSFLLCYLTSLLCDIDIM